MNMLVWVPLLIQVAIPIALVGWLAVRSPSHLQSLAKAIAVGAYLAMIAVAGLWLVAPWYLPIMYGVLFGPALLLSFQAARQRPVAPQDWRGWMGVSLHGAIALLCGVVILTALRGRHPPGEPVDLAFPLRGGTYVVANGGGTPLLNAHLETLERERLRPYRGQSYGVDVVRVNSWGFRARGLYPDDPTKYVIFGDTVFAPCAGTAIQAVDGQPDLNPPETDRVRLAGNHVLLECGDVWVLLAHLKRGSVIARPTDPVGLGEPVGLVGNSGNTGEPHLHIHAQHPGSAAAPLGGQPVPLTFDGVYPVRSARFRAARPHDRPDAIRAVAGNLRARRIVP